MRWSGLVRQRRLRPERPAVLGQIGLSGRLGCALERPVEVSLHPGCVDAMASRRSAITGQGARDTADSISEPVTDMVSYCSAGTGLT
jgi:hypothetical protein